MSTAVQLAAFAFADALMGASPGAQPYRAVAFLLGTAGHQRAGKANPREINRRSRLLAKGVNAALRTQKGLDYDPLEIIEFNSFDELLGKRPPGGVVWQEVLLVTHASGEQPGRLQQLPGEIFFGSENFTISKSGRNDLLDAINAKITRVTRFRAGFADTSSITLIGCGVGAAGPDVAIYVRELFGTEGQVKFPIKTVDFFSDGQLGTPIEPEDYTHLRLLKPDEWGTVPGKAPYLVPTGLTVPPRPVARNGDGSWSFPVDWTVANKGGTDAQPSWSDGIYLSADQTLDTGDRQVTVTQHTQVVTAGSSYPVSATAIVPSSVAPGDYYVVVWPNQGPSTHEILVSANLVTLLP